MIFTILFGVIWSQISDSISASVFHSDNKDTLYLISNRCISEKSQVYHKILDTQEVKSYENPIISVHKRHKRFVSSENKHNIIMNNIQYHKMVLIIFCILITFGVTVFCIRKCYKYIITKSGDLQRKYVNQNLIRSGLRNIVYNPNCSIPTVDYYILIDDVHTDTLNTPLII